MCTSQGVSDRGPLRDGSKTSSVQYIIYNIKRDLRKLVSSCENDLAVFDLEFPLPLRNPLLHPPKKNIHNLPKDVSPSRRPHHQVYPKAEYHLGHIFSFSILRYVDL
jgi:hypothetical protein